MELKDLVETIPRVKEMSKVVEMLRLGLRCSERDAKPYSLDHSKRARRQWEACIFVKSRADL